MSKTPRFALGIAICFLTGAALAQTAGPRAGIDATGMDGKALNGAGLNSSSASGTAPGAGAAKPADAPDQKNGPRAGIDATGMDGKALNGAALNGAGAPGAASAGAGAGDGATKPNDAPVGLQPAPGTGAKAAP